MLFPPTFSPHYPICIETQLSSYLFSPLSLTLRNSNNCNYRVLLSKELQMMYSHYLSCGHRSLWRKQEIGNIILTSQKGNLCHRKVKCIVQGHTTNYCMFKPHDVSSFRSCSLENWPHRILLTIYFITDDWAT